LWRRWRDEPTGFGFWTVRRAKVRRRPHRRPSPLGTTWRAGIHYCTRRQVEIDKRVPMLRLSGHGLEDAGFLLGQECEIDVADGRLVLRVV
jgi:hypothetical protein